jgi:hypothetical protein
MKNKNCMICKLGIKIGTEEYVEVKHNGIDNNIICRGFYHLNCFRERLNSSSLNNQLQKKAIEMLDKIGCVV